MARTFRKPRTHANQTNPNRVHLRTSKNVRSFQDEWADYAEVEVKYSGSFDSGRIAEALSGLPSVVGVGGAGTIRSVSRVDDSTLRYVVRYWIPD